MKNYYKILGVKITANLDEIKKVYRKLAMQFHPDKNPDNKAAEERFKEIQEAYEHLSCDDKRRLHDQHLQWEEQQRNTQTRTEQPFNWGPIIMGVVLFILVAIGLSAALSSDKKRS